MQKRPETGPMRFGADLTGIFLRGDDAVPMAIHLRSLLETLERREAPSPLDLHLIRSFADRLLKCDETFQLEEVQLLLSFEECLMSRPTERCPPPV